MIIRVKHIDNETRRINQVFKSKAWYSGGTLIDAITDYINDNTQTNKTYTIKRISRCIYWVTERR